VTPPFRTLSYRRREALKMPTLPLVFLPHPMMNRSAEEIEDIADRYADVIARIFVGDTVADVEEMS
jgi:hypothetical protein